MTTTLEQDMKNEIRERCFAFPKDEIEREINREITAEVTKKYDKRISARESNLAASAGRGASHIPGWLNKDEPVTMGRSTAPFAVSHPILGVLIYLAVLAIVVVVVVGIVLGIASLAL